MSSSTDSKTPITSALSENIALSEQEHANRLAEYGTLRDDILKRIQFRYQLLNILLIVAGTFLSIGSSLESTNVALAPILLVYPILALFLAAGWAHNGVVIATIGQYIKNEIEPKMHGLNWQSTTEKAFPQFSSFSILGLISTSGLILTTQILATFLALLRFTATTIEIVLLIASIIAIILTVVLLRYARNIRR